MTTTCVAGIVLLATAISSPISLLAIPAIALVAEVAPVMGERIGQVIFNSMSSTKSAHAKLNQCKAEILAEVEKLEKATQNTKQTQIETNIELTKLKAIKEGLNGNISLNEMNEMKGVSELQEFDPIKTSLAKYIVAPSQANSNNSKPDQITQERQRAKSTDNDNKNIHQK